MKARYLLILIPALLAAGCSSIVDKVIARVGGPERGFLTPDILADAGPSGSAAFVMASGCTPSSCIQAPGFCSARGYQPGTEAYSRCVVSVSQNLRAARR